MLRGRSLLAAASLVICVFLAGPPAARAGEGDAGQFLVALSEKAISQLSDQSIAESERRLRFRTLLDDNFDMPTIGRFVLGAFARRATPEERAAFLEAFRDVLTQRFLPYFRDYKGEAFQIGEVKPDRTNPKLTLVVSQIFLADGSPLPVAWRVARRGEGYKIVDVVAEGVSLALTFRSEYSSVLKQSNGDIAELTTRLRQKLASSSFAPATN